MIHLGFFGKHKNAVRHAFEQVKGRVWMGVHHAFGLQQGVGIDGFPLTRGEVYPKNESYNVWKNLHFCYFQFASTKVKNLSFNSSFDAKNQRWPTFEEKHNGHAECYAKSSATSATDA